MKAKDLTKKLDEVFSEYIRLRDFEKGCICGCGYFAVVPKGDNSWHAGHFISRRFKATRWDETNVNGQCKNCNFKQKFGDIATIIKHEHGIRERYGDDGLNKLINHEKIRPFKSREMIDLISYYEKKIQELKG